VDFFVEKLKEKRVRTVGQFCSLKAFQLKGLPIAHRRRSSTGVEAARERIGTWLQETGLGHQPDDANVVN
jgi:hypothetical protein